MRTGAGSLSGSIKLHIGLARSRLFGVNSNSSHCARVPEFAGIFMADFSDLFRANCSVHLSSHKCLGDGKMAMI